MTTEPSGEAPRDGADQAETEIRERRTSVDDPIDNSLAAQVDRVRNDKDFTERLRAIIARDKELLDRLAE